MRGSESRRAAKERRKRRILATTAGIITLSLILATQASNIKHMYVSVMQSGHSVETATPQEYNASTFQSLVEKYGVILTKDSLSTILGPPVRENVDAVTSATPSIAQSWD